VPIGPATHVSRRGLLRQSAVIAAAATAGIAVGAVAGHALGSAPTAGNNGPWTVPLVPHGVWMAVMAEGALAVGAVQRLGAEHVAGYL
jgi:hypothetical protein